MSIVTRTGDMMILVDITRDGAGTSMVRCALKADDWFVKSADVHLLNCEYQVYKTWNLVCSMAASTKRRFETSVINS